MAYSCLRVALYNLLLLTDPIPCLTSWCCRFFGRPKKTITKSQYNAAAKQIAVRAQEMAKAAKELRNEENAGGRSRQWRNRTKELGKQLSLLEDDERALEKQYPQVCSTVVAFLYSLWARERR
jgi:hypothetical protein